MGAWPCPPGVNLGESQCGQIVKFDASLGFDRDLAHPPPQQSESNDPPVSGTTPNRVPPKATQIYFLLKITSRWPSGSRRKQR